MRRASLFAFLSIALHVAWVITAPRTPVRAAESRPNEIEFSLVEPVTPPTEPEPEPEPEPESPPPPAHPVAIKEKEPVKPKPTPSVATLEPVQPATLEPTPAESVSQAPSLPAAPSGKMLDLSPRAAALALAPSPQPQDALHCSAERRLPSGESCDPNLAAEAKAQAELTRNLRAIAVAVPHLKQRDKPQLQRRSDGTYEYAGHVFSARIGTDGQVAFSDGATSAALRFSTMPLRVTMDINDLAEAAQKKELYTAEKRWFLEQTTELRDQLADAYRIKEAAGARRALEQELDRILAAHDRSSAQKRADVFALWQDCGEDGQAMQVRRIVEAFVQRRMPQDSELGFNASELERLNRGRAGLRTFQPYRTASAGGAPG